MTLNYREIAPLIHYKNVEKEDCRASAILSALEGEN